MATFMVQLSPPAQAALEYHRGKLADGQLWRVFTASLVHFGWLHWLTDAAALAALSWIAARRRRRVLVEVALLATAVGAAVHLLGGPVGSYRGLSGVNYGLLAALLVTMARRAHGPASALGWGVLAVVIAKTAWELVVRAPLLPTALPHGVALVAEAHAAGVVVGVLLALCRARSRPSPGPVGSDPTARPCCKTGRPIQSPPSWR